MDMLPNGIFFPSFRAGNPKVYKQTVPFERKYTLKHVYRGVYLFHVLGCQSATGWWYSKKYCNMYPEDVYIIKSYKVRTSHWLLFSPLFSLASSAEPNRFGNPKFWEFSPQVLVYVWDCNTQLYNEILLMAEIPNNHLGCCVNLVNNGIFTLSTGAGFIPSTVWWS